MAQTLRSASLSVQRNTADLNRLQDELTEVQVAYGKAASAANRFAVERAEAIVGPQERRARRNRAGQSVLAGAAFANIPGQDLAQAVGAGALVGGGAGALIAGGVAATLKLTTALANFGRQATITAAEVSKLGIALQSVLGPDAEQGFAAINRAVEDFNQPLADATRQFTQLAASAQANGNTVAEVENLYRGLSSAVKATGGTTEDLSGVLRAATQVLSKGKVQAEELRGQIGDRLPGAFALFAEATGRSTAELDEALKNGEVRAEEFVTAFADLLREKYEPAAKLIGDSPAEAGARLEASLTKLQVSVGRLLGPIGAAFQDTFTKIFNVITKASDALARFLGIGLDNAIAKTLRELEAVEQRIARGQRGQGGRRGEDNQRFTAQRNALQAELARLQAQKEAAEAAAGVRTRPTQPPTTTPTTPDPVSGIDLRIPPGVDDPTQRIAALQQQIALERSLLALEQAKSGLTDNQITNREVAIRLANDLLRVNQDIEDSRERQATIDLLLLRNARDLAVIENARKQAFTSSIQDLQDQTELAKVLSTRKREELQIEQDIARLKQTGEIRDPGEEEQFRSARLGLLDATENTNRLREETERLQSVYNGIGTTITNGLVEGLLLATKATEDLGEQFKKLAANILNAVAQQLLLNAVKAGLSSLGGNDGVGIFTALAGGLTTRASGGPLSQGQASFVGENGTEIFVPGKSGQVFSNEEIFAATRAAVANTQTSGEDAFDQNAQALGTSAEIIKETMRETQIAMLGSDSSSETIRFETYSVGGMDVVTREEALKIGKNAAAAAKASVFTDLKNKPRIRAGIGL